MNYSIERPLKCIVIDDEPLARELLKTYLERTPGLHLEGCFGSAAEAIKTVMTGETDLVFLDINMPLLDGIEFGRLIPERTRIIYVTAYDSYAVEGFKVNALDYLLKPVSYSEFLKAVRRGFEWFAMREASTTSSKMITVKAEGRLIQMKTDSILYIEVRKDRLIFFRKEGEEVTALMSMKEIEEILPASQFMRVHRSFIVNLNNVEVVERNRIVFGNTFIPISNSRREEFLSRISNS